MNCSMHRTRPWYDVIDDNEFSGLTEGDYFVAIVDGNTCRDSSDVFGSWSQ